MPARCDRWVPAFPNARYLVPEADNAAVFVGDLVHTPVQLLRAPDSCAFDLDADEAGRSRRAVLTAAARARATVLPAHFAGQGAVTLTVGDDDEPTLGRWAEFPAI
jgi:glyoxylase-like metal-dependent hydrolase (beta-lactamase superfamily II)